MSRIPHRKQKDARPHDDAGRLLCDRCGLRVVGWMLRRPDNCGRQTEISVSCRRQPTDVVASWRRYGWEIDLATKEARHGTAVLGRGRGRVVDLRDTPGREAEPVSTAHASTAAIAAADDAREHATADTTPPARRRGLVYLLHFTSLYKHARHYLGATGKTLDERVSAHRGGECSGDHDGRPAKLITALLNDGGDFVVARTWETATRRAAFLLERQLKKRGSRRRLCPICQPPGLRRRPHESRVPAAAREPDG